VRRRRLAECEGCQANSHLLGRRAFVADSSMGLGRQIEGLRTEIGMSQLELATRAGVSRETVSNVETGKTSPRADVLFKIYDALGRELIAVPSSLTAQLKLWMSVNTK